jgi:hypothetical protein
MYEFMVWSIQNFAVSEAWKVDGRRRAHAAPFGERLLLAHQRGQHAAQPRHEVLGHADVQDGRDEVLADDDRARAIAHELRDAHGLVGVARLGAEEERRLRGPRSPPSRCGRCSRRARSRVAT